MIAAWFAYDVDDGFSFHDTEAEARACAESAMDRYRDNAAGQEWDEETEDICWGRVRQRAFVTSREPAPEGTDYDETVDYGLVEVSEDLALPCPHAAERDAAHREIEEAERVLCAEPIDGRDDLATCARQVVANMDALRSAFDALARAVEVAIVEMDSQDSNAGIERLAAAARTAVKAREHLRAP